MGLSPVLTQTFVAVISVKIAYDTFTDVTATKVCVNKVTITFCIYIIINESVIFH